MALEIVIVSVLFTAREPGEPLVVNPVTVMLHGAIAAGLCIPGVVLFTGMFYPFLLGRVALRLCKYVVLGPCFLLAYVCRRARRRNAVGPSPPVPTDAAGSASAPSRPLPQLTDGAAPVLGMAVSSDGVALAQPVAKVVRVAGADDLCASAADLSAAEDAFGDHVKRVRAERAREERRAAARAGHEAAPPADPWTRVEASTEALGRLSALRPPSPPVGTNPRLSECTGESGASAGRCGYDGGREGGRYERWRTRGEASAHARRRHSAPSPPPSPPTATPTAAAQRGGPGSTDALGRRRVSIGGVEIGGAETAGSTESDRRAERQPSGETTVETLEELIRRSAPQKPSPSSSSSSWSGAAAAKSEGCAPEEWYPLMETAAVKVQAAARGRQGRSATAELVGAEACAARPASTGAGPDVARGRVEDAPASTLSSPVPSAASPRRRRPPSLLGAVLNPTARVGPSVDDALPPQGHAGRRVSIQAQGPGVSSAGRRASGIFGETSAEFERDFDVIEGQRVFTQASLDRHRMRR